MQAGMNNEIRIVPCPVRTGMYEVFTTEFLVSRNFIEKLPRGNPAPATPNPEGALFEPGFRLSGTFVILSISSSTLTVRAPYWQHCLIHARVEQIEKNDPTRKSKPRK